MRDQSLPRLAPNALFHRCYRVIRCLKAGGMGAVYEVVDERTDARRALKVMLPDIVGDPDLRARFAREAWITSNVESEHIVRTVDTGVDEDTLTPFIAMELLRGEDLGSLLAKRKTLPPYEVVHYLFQIARALDRTHAAGIVHLDLKPENLFLTRRDDGSPCVKLLDFGISQLVEQSGRDRTTRCIGTPLYLGPQRVSRRSAIDPRTDLYALGHTTFSLLVGAPYWEKEWRASETQFAFMTKVTRGVREPASARARFRGVTLSTAFDAWFLKATSVPIDERFDSAGEAIERLAEVLDVPLPRPSLAEIEPAEDATGSTGSVMASGSTCLAGESTVPMASERSGGATLSAMRSARTSRSASPRIAPTIALGTGLATAALFGLGSNAPPGVSVRWIEQKMVVPVNTPEAAVPRQAPPAASDPEPSAPSTTAAPVPTGFASAGTAALPASAPPPPVSARPARLPRATAAPTSPPAPSVSPAAPPAKERADHGFY